MNLDLWEKKYKSKTDISPEDTLKRVARAISQGNAKLEQDFYAIMSELKFLPGGRILAYAGTENPKATLANCYVMGEIEDSMDGIMQSLYESALTLKAGGGIGINFSTLRPKGDFVSGTSSVASGPVSFMEMWNSMSRTISGVNQRKGAMIAVLNVDHPDIESFITAKALNTPENPVLEKFNISVGVTDDFMIAVKNDSEFSLTFNGKEYKRIPAKQIMDLIIENAWAKAEPGVVFLDTINKLNNLWYCETINSTNPCGELPLPPYGACMLGAINLAKFVINPFGEKPEIDWNELKRVIRLAVTFLDNTIDVCYYPVEEQRKQAELKRRIGLGVMGLGSALAMLKVRYGSDESKKICQKIFSFIRDNAYQTSIELAKKKGAFPLFDKEKYLESEFIKRLPEHIKKGIENNGIRNSCLLTIAPTGSISQLADYVSSGVEPIFCLEYVRKNPNYGQEILVQDYAWKVYKELHPNADVNQKPDFFVTAYELTWKEHIDVMSICQYYVDNAIS
ncbi:MAG: adenosylcobalamin-dependent ribonucleoside-diphosphate reductase, partial [Candidatus Methanofastidiosum sp.]|nr:adenosylcobalamin-dependent ribonucleoside-diphosphate reductase [Methanofastidiosum sp.]